MRKRINFWITLPVVGVAAVADSLLLYSNPITSAETSIAGAVVLAVLVCSVIGFAVAPWFSQYVAARTQPWTAPGLLAIATVAIALAGLAHQEQVITPSEALDANAGAVKGIVMDEAAEQFQRNLAGATVWKLRENLFRTCIPPNDPEQLAYCVVVDTSDTKRPQVRSAGVAENNIKRIRRLYGKPTTPSD